MDSKFLGLPPLRRLRLMQQQEDLQKLKEKANQEETAVGYSPLPAKKRKESRDSIFLHDPPVSAPAPAPAYSLPAKKRVWALQPDFSSNIDVLPFDLNVEYKPSTEDDKKTVGEKEPSNEISLVLGCANQSIENAKYEREEDRGAVAVSGFVIESAEISQDETEEDNGAVVAAEFVNEPVENSQYGTEEDRGAVVFTDFINVSVEVSQDENEESLGEEVADCVNESIENAIDKEEKDKVAEVVDCVTESVEIAKDEKEDRGELVADYANQSVEIAQDQKGASKGEDLDATSDDDDGIVCAVCQSTDGDPTDPIVMCDGCDLMVHATCYGNPLAKGIPDGDWFCEQCLVLPSFQNEKEKKGVSCCLCPVMNGALKPTTDKRWAHIVCALLVPEVFFGDPEGREGINCSRVPEKRWLQKCYICNSSNGCSILCSEPKCPLAFHVTCGLKEDLSIEYKEGNKSATIVAGFCKIHTEAWRKLQQSGKYKIVAREEKR